VSQNRNFFSYIFYRWPAYAIALSKTLINTGRR